MTRRRAAAVARCNDGDDYEAAYWLKRSGSSWSRIAVMRILASKPGKKK